MINIDSTKDSNSSSSSCSNNNINFCGEIRKPVANNSEFIKSSNINSSSSSQNGRKSTSGQQPREKLSESHCDNNFANKKQIEPTNVEICNEKLPLSSSSSSASSDDRETEEWQLLELDELLIEEGEVSNMDQTNIINDNGNSIGYMNGNKDENNYADAYGQAGLLKSDKKKRYLDVDPPKLPRHSPALVYLCTAIYAILPAASILALFALIGLLFTRFYFITIIYFAYILWDRNTCNRGGRRLNFVYYSKFWSYLAAYFPIKLRHSSEFKLDPSENYILNYHPHGIAAFGAVVAFATNGLHLGELFPGIKARFMVHETSFVVPLMKEAFGLRGDCSVNSKSIDHMLTKNSTGNLLAIVVGGLAEADLSNSETLKIVVAERKGFVKKALIHGANIIPCIAFGENSVFKKVDLEPNSLMYRLQTKWYELFKFKHPVYYGRGILFEKAKGLMPYKRPITVVMGDPIKVERVVDPSQEDIDKLHANYLKQLRAIYESNGHLRVKYDTKMELL